MRGIIKLEKKSLFPLIVGAGVFGLGFFAVSIADDQGVETSNNQLQKTGPLVETITAEKVDGHYGIEAPGRLQPRQQLSIVAEVSGKVTYVNPKFVVGGRLSAGDILFEINSVDYEAEVVRSKAAVAGSQASLIQAELANTRQLDLVRQGAVSEAAKDTAVANLATAKASLLQAKAQLQRAEENLKRTKIKAPFPALVSNETVSLDTYVAPGQTIGTLIDTRAGELIAGLPPEKAAAVSRVFQGNAGTLKAIAKPNSGSVGSTSLEGYIDQFSPAIDEASRSALIVAVFPGAFSPENEGLVFANDFMTLEITMQSPVTVWKLPVGVVRKGSYVWLVDNDKLTRRDITVINTTDETTLVTSKQSLENVKILSTLLSEESSGLHVHTAQTTTVAAR